MTAPVPVLEIGGTHVSSALVDPSDWTVSSAARRPLDADAPVEQLIESFLGAAREVAVPAGTRWGVAIPDPFDYERGIGLFAGVGKFGALRGVEVGTALRAGLRANVLFVHDADAFLLGEWTAGAVRGAARCIGLTLGTGVGSAWLVDGAIVEPGNPPGGRIHRLDVAGAPLEDVVSRRAIRRAYVIAGGDPSADVREIAAGARVGEATARGVLDTAMSALGAVVGRCNESFRADVLVIGGSMSASWDVLGPPFAAAAALPRAVLAADAERAPLIGAAAYVASVAP